MLYYNLLLYSLHHLNIDTYRQYQYIRRHNNSNYWMGLHQHYMDGMNYYNLFLLYKDHYLLDMYKYCLN